MNQSNVIKLRPYEAAFEVIEYTKMKIEPCPFCRGDAALEPEMGDDGSDHWYVTCNNKNCLVHPISNSFKSKHQAIRSWNYRG